MDHHILSSIRNGSPTFWRNAAKPAEKFDTFRQKCKSVEVAKQGAA